jgi:hypothetical protein
MTWGVTQKGTDGLPLGSVHPPGQTNPVPLQGGLPYTDANGNTSSPGVMALSDGWRVTYSAGIAAMVPATTAGDCFVINASATKLVRLSRVMINGTATTATTLDITLVRRSTLDTAGTSTTPAMVPHDATDAAATALVRAYTVAPTAGTFVGILRASKLLLAVPAATGAMPPLEWDFGNLAEKQPLLRAGTTHCYAVTISAIPSGGSLDIAMEFTEE